MEEIRRESYSGYEDLDKELKRSLKRSAAEVVRFGFLLRRMKDEQKYLVSYPDFESYLRGELHIDYSRANRFMNINKRFSFNGNSMVIDEKYEEYSQSLLEEMLNMPADQEGRIEPGMTARQAREIKRQVRQQEQENAFDVDYKEIETRQERMIATSQEPVDTESEVDQQEEIVVEIEVGTEAGPEQEGLSVEFDTDDLLRDLDDAIDTEYREMKVPEPNRADAALSAYGLPKTEYSPDCLPVSKGCGNGRNEHDALSMEKSSVDTKAENGKNVNPSQSFDERRKRFLHYMETKGMNEQWIETAEGELRIVIDALADYYDIASSNTEAMATGYGKAVWKNRLERIKQIQTKLEESTGYSRDRQLETCMKRKPLKDSDVGEDAMVLMYRRGKSAAEKKKLQKGEKDG